jgi:hypothetical protein
MAEELEELEFSSSCSVCQEPLPKVSTQKFLRVNNPLRGSYSLKVNNSLRGSNSPKMNNSLRVSNSVVDPELFFFGSRSDFSANFGSGSSFGSGIKGKTKTLQQHCSKNVKKIC